MRHERQSTHLSAGLAAAQLDVNPVPRLAGADGDVAHGDVLAQGRRKGTTGDLPNPCASLQDLEARPRHATWRDLQSDELSGRTFGLERGQGGLPDETRFTQVDHPAQSRL